MAYKGLTKDVRVTCTRCCGWTNDATGVAVHAANTTRFENFMMRIEKRRRFKEECKIQQKQLERSTAGRSVRSQVSTKGREGRVVADEGGAGVGTPNLRFSFLVEEGGWGDLLGSCRHAFEQTSLLKFPTPPPPMSRSRSWLLLNFKKGCRIRANFFTGGVLTCEATQAIHAEQSTYVVFLRSYLILVRSVFCTMIVTMTETGSCGSNQQAESVQQSSEGCSHLPPPHRVA